jgi:ribonuclease HI
MTAEREAAGQAIEMYADGACKGNPGPGGWGVLLRRPGAEKELFGAEPQTTNNRMELTAVIRGLEALRKRCAVDVYTDSQYVHKGISEWIRGWKRNGWRTADKKPVKNDDLWRRLDELALGHDVRWHWVKGHAGHEGNERADALANRAIEELRKGVVQ